MSEETAALLWLSFAAYLGMGFCVAFPTLVIGLNRLSPNVTAMPLRVRLLISPGLVLLWPLVIARLAGVRAKEDQ